MSSKNVVIEYVVAGNTAGFSADVYDSAKVELEEIEENFSRGAMLRSKAEYIEKGEKPTKFFLNLEKSRSAANTINKLHVQSSNGLAEIKSQNEVQAHIKHYYASIFSCNQSYLKMNVRLSLTK